jgi:hypothetical protein
MVFLLIFLIKEKINKIINDVNFRQISQQPNLCYECQLRECFRVNPKRDQISFRKFRF